MRMCVRAHVCVCVRARLTLQLCARLRAGAPRRYPFPRKNLLTLSCGGLQNSIGMLACCLDFTFGQRQSTATSGNQRQPIQNVLEIISLRLSRSAEWIAITNFNGKQNVPLQLPTFFFGFRWFDTVRLWIYRILSGNSVRWLLKSDVLREHRDRPTRIPI